MNQKQIYQDIAAAHASAMASGQVTTDNYLAGQKVDTRRGISLIIPCVRLGRAYETMGAEFEQSCPGQYVYPLSDLHITVFDYIPGSTEYIAAPEQDARYTAITQAVLSDWAPLSVHFKGVVFSAAAGMICGYDNGRLVKLRAAIRSELNSRNIAFTERYASQTAHITFMRFVQQPLDVARLVKCRDSWCGHDFGDFLLTEMQLVEHDWYNQQKNSRLIKSFSLV